MLPIAESAMKGRRPIVFVNTPKPEYMKKAGSKSAMSINKEVLVTRDLLAPWKNAEGIATHPSLRREDFRTAKVPKNPDLPKLHALKPLKTIQNETLFVAAKAFN